MEDGPIRLSSGVSSQMTKYLSRAMIVVLLVFLKMPLRADSIPEIVAKAKPAIVEIVVTDATGAPKMLGTLPTVTPTPPADAVAHFDSGMAFLERQEYDKAINDFTEAIRLDPNYVPAYVSRGNAYGIHGAVDKAINDFTEAIRLDPNVAIIYFNRGNAYYDHGNLDKASSDYSEAIRLDPNFARAYVGRADVIRDQGNLDKAIGDYNEAI